MSEKYSREMDVSWIHYSTDVREIGSAADFEVIETYDDNIDHYRENRYSHIPIPYSEEYYDIEEEELKTLTREHVVNYEIEFLEVVEKLLEVDFLFYDNYSKRVIDQPNEDSLPYRYENGKITVDGTVYGPRQVYGNYNELKSQLPESKHDLLLGLADERHRYHILTLQDVNKRAVRSFLYQLVMQLETRFGELVRSQYNSKDLFKNVNPSAVGRWVKQDLRGNRTHIVEFLTVGELKDIIG